MHCNLGIFYHRMLAVFVFTNRHLWSWSEMEEICHLTGTLSVQNFPFIRPNKTVKCSPPIFSHYRVRFSQKNSFDFVCYCKKKQFQDDRKTDRLTFVWKPSKNVVNAIHVNTPRCLKRNFHTKAWRRSQQYWKVLWVMVGRGSGLWNNCNALYPNKF